MTKFSVIIPTFNNLELCQRALNSVLAQDYGNYEVIIVDDSIDNAIEDYVTGLNDHKISYHHNIPSKGAVGNWNSGLLLASGDYIIVLHHDEAFGTKRHLSKLSALINKDIDCIVCGIKVFDGEDERPALFSYRTKRYVVEHPSLLFLCNTIGPCACLCFRNAILKQFNPKLKWLVDVEWYYRILYRHQVAITLTDCYILSQNAHLDKITDSIDVKSTEISDVKVINQIYKFNITIRFFAWINKVVVIYDLKGLIKKLLRK